MKIAKTKTKRRIWWLNLSEEEKAAYIEKVQKYKEINRENKTLALMVKYGQKFQCSFCFHRKTGSCVDNLPNGCQYWFSPNSSYQGIAYLYG